MNAEKKLARQLQLRKEKELLRTLTLASPGLVDFCSNDYLGFSQSGLLAAEVAALEKKQVQAGTGSGGSRLLAGNSRQAEQLEKRIAAFHGSEGALLFNSGYDANLGFFSCVPQKGDLIFYDELVHASIIDGIRLSRAAAYKFRHSSLDDLRKKIKLQAPAADCTVFIAVESVYSMDGDIAPQTELAQLCAANGYALVVDEAHATGIFGEQGRGLCCSLGLEANCFARIFTYGKAMGTHGAAVCGSAVLKNFLVNFSRPFIFSTALPPHSLLSVEAAYNLLEKDSVPVSRLQKNINLFCEKFSELPLYRPGCSAIQVILVPGNSAVQEAAAALQSAGFDVRPVKSPTVKQGEERLRISLHAFNTAEEINSLFLALSSHRTLPV